MPVEFAEKKLNENIMIFSMDVNSVFFFFFFSGFWVSRSASSSHGVRLVLIGIRVEEEECNNTVKTRGKAPFA